MNKRERVMAALDGRGVDRVPYTMWRHFYYQAQTAEGLTRSTLDFYRQYGMDLIVLAPGPFYIAESWGVDVRSFSADDVSPYLGGALIQRPTDWRQLPEPEVERCSLRREIDAVRQIRTQLDDEDAPLIIPILSPFETADMLCQGRAIQDMRTYPNDLRDALEIISAVTSAFAFACLGAGADGVMLVSRQASQGRIRSREYREFVQRFDLEVLDRLREAAIRVFLFDSERPLFDVLDHYPVHAVCWQTWRSNPSLSVASHRFDGALMGGLNPMTFSSGSVADVREQIADAIGQTGGWRLILAPSGPLPPDSEDELLSSVSQVLGEG